MGTILDITERKRNEERQRLLMAELDHRVKNILGNVAAMARLSSHRAQSVEDFVRVAGRAHPGDLQRARPAAPRRMGRRQSRRARLRSSVAVPVEQDNIEIEGEPVSVVPELAQSMALILHELATNAVKHGALSKPSGHVKVSWSRLGRRAAAVRLAGSGGPRVDAADEQGLRPDRPADRSGRTSAAVANCDFQR